MDQVKAAENERSVMRWGGLAGIAGGILLVAVFGIVGVFIGEPAATPAATAPIYPDIRAARMVEEVLYLGVLALWAIHFIALYHVLRRTRLASALFGGALGIMGLVVLTAGALPQVAKAPLSALYHAPGATSQEQATIVFIWQATQGMLEALLVTGLLLVPIGLIGLGVAMFSAPAFGKGYGGLSVALGAVGFAAAAALVVDVSEIAIVVMLSLILFNVVLGRKLFSLSRALTEPDLGEAGEAAGERALGGSRQRDGAVALITR